MIDQAIYEGNIWALVLAGMIIAVMVAAYYGLRAASSRLDRRLQAPASDPDWHYIATDGPPPSGRTVWLAGVSSPGSEGAVIGCWAGSTGYWCLVGGNFMQLPDNVAVYAYRLADIPDAPKVPTAPQADDGGRP